MKALDRFHVKHPRISTAAAILIVFAIMLIGRQWDRADDAAVRQWMASAKVTT
ncbi:MULTISPECIES: hypothetical protein [unclassified Burkholderia]|uniref:hypothetical protein n=1 Tax=unclassified Burkholderia TaxID=2613784 RepID=UPI001639CFBB|nr:MULTISPECIES: hypothetical protein [unclassified Burkholderia]